MYELSGVETIQRFSVALAIGLLVGLERGWRTRDEGEGERAAGLRTHGLVALLGGVWGALAQPFGGAGVIALALVFILVGAVVAIFRFRETLRDETFGATSVVALMLCFALGALAVVGEPSAAAAAAVATTAILALKEFLHGVVKAMTWAELRSVLLLLAMSFILLPVLPNRAIDKWDAVNPYELWLMTVLIGAVSFAGYVAVKLIGYRRGVAVAGIAGGLASSTATTVEMSRLAHESQDQADALSGAAVFANMAMGPRLLALIGLVYPPLALFLALPLLAATVAFGACGLFLIGRAGSRPAGEGPARAMRNPLDIVAVLQFGALLAVVMILSRVVAHFSGSAGVYALALASGVADVDAISLSMARLGVREIGLGAAATAILLALGANTATKVGIGFLIGGARMGMRLALASALAVGAAALAFWFIPASGP